MITDGYFYFIHNRQFIQIARIGNIVARLGDKNTSFPNMCYLLEHTDVYLVTFFELADCNIIGYLPNMIPNVLVFLFIIRALFLLSLINATIMVIVFWRRGIQQLVFQLKKNLEEQDKLNDKRILIKSSAKVYSELENPSICYFINTLDSYLDFGSIIMHLCKQRMNFMIEGILF